MLTSERFGYISFQFDVAVVLVVRRKHITTLLEFHTPHCNFHFHCPASNLMLVASKTGKTSMVPKACSESFDALFI